VSGSDQVRLNEHNCSVIFANEDALPTELYPRLPMKIESEHSTENSLCTPIFKDLSKTGWSLGWVAAVDSEGTSDLDC